MNEGSDLLSRAVLGAAGGFAGTLVIQALLGASRRFAPGTLPPLREEPGRFMVKKAEQALPELVRGRIPEAAERAAAGGLALGYGLAFGVLYALVRPQGGNPLVEGLALGTACWAVGYLGWLPALGLLPPVWEQRAPQALAPVAEHLVYGMTTVAAYDWLRRRVEG
ncbi:MAG: hypothetical protein IRY99_00080 [Isosphaeraceae bacterium]|nr:hypothetical protein [Isosphaeraceae bacterium]